VGDNKVNLSDSDLPSLLTIAFKFGDWLHTLLQFWIIINSAIVGWILTTKPFWYAAPKIIVTVLYLLIISTNLVWILHLYSWLKKILSEIEETAKGVNFQFPDQNVRPILRSVSNVWWWRMLFAAHTLSDLFVIYCILYLTNNLK
jgi:hypothetical protein